MNRGSGGKTLLSAEWAKLIEYEGQVFPGGANEFRKSLIKYSIEVGFGYKYLKNEPDRVMAECKFKLTAKCEWKIHATRDRPRPDFILRTFNNVHNCERILDLPVRRSSIPRLLLILSPMTSETCMGCPLVMYKAKLRTNLELI